MLEECLAIATSISYYYIFIFILLYGNHCDFICKYYYYSPLKLQGEPGSWIDFLFRFFRLIHETKYTNTHLCGCIY